MCNIESLHFHFKDHGISFYLNIYYVRRWKFGSMNVIIMWLSTNKTNLILISILISYTQNHIVHVLIPASTRHTALVPVGSTNCPRRRSRGSDISMDLPRRRSHATFHSGVCWFGHLEWFSDIDDGNKSVLVLV